jgi:hypothetical protein
VTDRKAKFQALGAQMAPLETADAHGALAERKNARPSRPVVVGYRTEPKVVSDPTEPEHAATEIPARLPA